MPDTLSPCHLKETPAPPNLPLTAIDGQRRLVAAERNSTTCPVSLKNVGLSGVILSGGSLSNDTMEAVNAVATTTRRFVAYEDVVKVGARSPGVPITPATCAMPRLRSGPFLAGSALSPSLRRSMMDELRSATFISQDTAT